VTDVLDWFADPANWTGPDGLAARLVEHLILTAVTVGIAVLIALPLGLWLGHLGRGGALATNVSYVGRAAPTFAVLVLLALAPPPFGLNTLSTVTALVLFAIPPLLTNSYVGIRGVDPDTVDAARGMGLSEWQVLGRVELPLAAPLIVGGLRLATVQVIATATIAALVAGGGLGRIITRAYANQDDVQLIAGSLVVAGLALAAEGGFSLVQRLPALRGVPA
jgi:osmoprotectant transport system permease protein